MAFVRIVCRVENGEELAVRSLLIVFVSCEVARVRKSVRIVKAKANRNVGCLNSGFNKAKKHAESSLLLPWTAYTKFHKITLILHLYHAFLRYATSTNK